MNKKVTGKYKLELNFVGGGIVYLNYWDYMYGNDVIAEFDNGVLRLDDEPTEISLTDFLYLVSETISKYPKQ